MDDLFLPANVATPLSIVSRVLALIDESRLNPTDEPVIKWVTSMHRAAVTYSRISLDRKPNGNAPPHSTDSNRWITPKEAAARTGYTVERIRQLLNAGRLVARRHGRMWLIDPESLWTKPRRRN